jgi:DNA-binding transcriptional MerR regulator
VIRDAPLLRAQAPVYSPLPVTAYTLGDVARICGVSRRRLRYWERTALVGPLPDEDDETAFDFRALVSVRTIVGLLESGVPLRRIRSSVEAVRARMPEIEALPALRTWGSSERIVLRHQGVLMEPGGQLVLDLSGESSGAVEPLGDRGAGERARRAALGWFERGCELDTDRETYEDAVAAYLRALEVDPEFADAHCNLGSVYFNQDRRDRARTCFERAVELEPSHVEANLNLGTLREEEGADESALRHYRAALEADAHYPDTHVSLALVYEKLKLPRTALAHWRRYLQLDPMGSWADLARRRLKAH